MAADLTAGAVAWVEGVWRLPAWAITIELVTHLTRVRDIKLPAACISGALLLGIAGGNEVHEVHKQLHKSAFGEWVGPDDHVLQPAFQMADILHDGVHGIVSQ